MFGIFENDLKNLEEFDKMIEFLDGEVPTDQDIWDVARESRNIPGIANIALDCSLRTIKELLEDNYPHLEVFYEVNCACSSLIINGENVYDVETLKGFLRG